jgi:hypothetical protein
MLGGGGGGAISQCILPPHFKSKIDSKELKKELKLFIEIGSLTRTVLNKGALAD